MTKPKQKNRRYNTSATSSRGNTKRRQPYTHKSKHTQQSQKTKIKTFRTPSGDAVRIIVVGGLEEVGRNCTFIEYKNDIIIIDLGLQFPEETMPGIDYIIPNIEYLRGKEKNVRGVIITHGHYDHIGGIPHIMHKIGNPPLYTLPLSAGIIEKRQTDFNSGKLNIKRITLKDKLQLGSFKVSFFHVNHNIPDCAAVVVETPAGTIIHTGDWKFDFHPVGTVPMDLHEMARLGDKGVLMVMGDSTNASAPGHQLSEQVIGKELENIIRDTKGRIIIGTFASLLSRVTQVIGIAEKHGRKVAIDGYSMKTNVEIAISLSQLKVNPRTFIPVEKVEDYPDDKVMIICTGAQGEKRAALNRIASDEHRHIKLKKGDTIIFSSSIVPGNEASVQKLKDTLYRKGAIVINKETMDVHAGGHAKKEDVKLMLTLLKPKYYMPIEGNHFLLRENAKVAYELGYNERNVFVADNGQVLEARKTRNGSTIRMTDEFIPSDYVFVDGLGVGDISPVVLRDRTTLADDGIVIVVAKIAKKTGKIVGNPDIVSRGFVHMKENQKLIDDTRQLIKKSLSSHDKKAMSDIKKVKDKLRDDVGKFLFKKTERRPMIMPVIIEI